MLVVGIRINVGDAAPINRRIGRIEKEVTLLREHEEIRFRDLREPQFFIAKAKLSRDRDVDVCLDVFDEVASSLDRPGDVPEPTERLMGVMQKRVQFEIGRNDL